MSKGSSGLFSGTSGSNADFLQKLEKLFSVSDSESTAIVWNHMVATQENYEKTIIPKSFEIDVPKSSITPDGKLWTHGNATEHVYEAVCSIKEHAPSIVNSNPQLYSQFILYDYYQSLGKVISRGIKYNRLSKIGNWEFIIVQARSGQKYPVVKHAMFTGLEK